MTHSVHASSSNTKVSYQYMCELEATRFSSSLRSVPVKREKNPAMRGKLCPILTERGVCEMPDCCDYAHSVSEARLYNQNFKTKLCGFAVNGHCKKASHCRYAHSYAELNMQSSDECSSPSGCSSVAGRSISTPSTFPAGLLRERGSSFSPFHVNRETSRKSSDSLLERPRGLQQMCYVTPTVPRRMFRRPVGSVPAAVMVPSSLHYVDQLAQPKYIVPRNVRVNKRAPTLRHSVSPPMLVTPVYAQAAVRPSQLFYHPAMGVYQPISVDFTSASVQYED